VARISRWHRAPTPRNAFQFKTGHQHHRPIAALPRPTGESEPFNFRGRCWSWWRQNRRPIHRMRWTSTTRATNTWTTGSPVHEFHEARRKLPNPPIPRHEQEFGWQGGYDSSGRAGELMETLGVPSPLALTSFCCFLGLQCAHRESHAPNPAEGAVKHG